MSQKKKSGNQMTLQGQPQNFPLFSISKGLETLANIYIRALQMLTISFNSFVFLSVSSSKKRFFYFCVRFCLMKSMNLDENYQMRLK